MSQLHCGKIDPAYMVEGFKVTVVERNVIQQSNYCDQGGKKPLGSFAGAVLTLHLFRVTS